MIASPIVGRLEETRRIDEGKGERELMHEGGRENFFEGRRAKAALVGGESGGLCQSWNEPRMKKDYPLLKKKGHRRLIWEKKGEGDYRIG